jgi:hypothetical protein
MREVRIEGFERYTIREDGVVTSHIDPRRPVQLIPQKVGNTASYHAVTVYNRELRSRWCVALHKLMWLTFMGDIPKGMTIDHMDGNPHNNHIDNLQLLSIRDNIQKGVRGRQDFTLRDYRDVLIEDYKLFGEYKRVADIWGVTNQRVHRVIRNVVHRKINGHYITVRYDESIDDKWCKQF